MTGKISSSALTRPVECDPYDTTLRPRAPAHGLHIKAPLPTPDIAPGGLEDDGRKLVDEVAAKVIRWLQRRLPEADAEPASDNELVFVVCSFDPDMDPVFDAVACAADAVGLRATRMDDCRITDKILTFLRSARVVVADLSHATPNVYIELGFALALGKTVITMARTGTIPHFEVHDWIYFEYVDSRPLEQQLRQRFRSVVDRCQE